MSQRILIVEDDLMSGFILSEMCERLGYESDVVRDGQDCIETLKQNPDRFDLVLMDIHMPRVSGLEASTHIRSTESDPPRNLPIIAVTADAHWHNPHKCKEHGFNDVISKPVTMMGLDDTVNSYLAA